MPHESCPVPPTPGIGHTLHAHWLMSYFVGGGGGVGWMDRKREPRRKKSALQQTQEKTKLRLLFPNPKVIPC